MEGSNSVDTGDSVDSPQGVWMNTFSVDTHKGALAEKSAPFFIC